MATASAITSTSNAMASILPSASWLARTRGSTSATNISTTAARRTAAFRHDPDGNALTVDEPLDRFDKTFFGDPDKSHAKAFTEAKFGIEHRFAEGLTLRNRTLFGDYDKFYQNVFPNRAANGAGTVALSAYNDATERQNLFTQTDLI